MTFLLENNFLGNKTGKGFYQKTDQKDQNGKTIINALDLNTLEYKPSVRPQKPHSQGSQSHRKHAQTYAVFDG